MTVRVRGRGPALRLQAASLPGRRLRSAVTWRHAMCHRRLLVQERRVGRDLSVSGRECVVNWRRIYGPTYVFTWYVISRAAVDDGAVAALSSRIPAVLYADRFCDDRGEVRVRVEWRPTETVRTTLARAASGLSAGMW